MGRRTTTLICLFSLAGGSALWLTGRPGRAEELRARERQSQPLRAVGFRVTAEPDVAPLVLDEPTELPARAHAGPSPRFDHTENYLLVGVDRVRGRALGRADTLILAVFDDVSGHVGLVSIPRDLYVEVPDFGPARINSAPRIAARLRRDALELLRSLTSASLAIPVQHVLVLDLQKFEEGIDRLGGLMVEVPCPIEDNFVDTRSPSGRRRLSVAAGRQHLDGVTSAMYARSRHGRSDWDRARRQQALLVALRNRAGEVGLEGWVPVALDTIEQGVATTMSRLELLRLLRRAAAIDRERLHGVVIGTRQTEIHWTPEHQAVLVPRYDAIDALLAGLFSAPPPGQRPAHKGCPDSDVALP